MKEYYYYILFNLKNKYEGTVLSYLWTLIPIILQFVILSFITREVFSVNDDNFSPKLFISLLVWSFFKEATSVASHMISFKWYHCKNYYIPFKKILRVEILTVFSTFILNLFLVLLYLFFTYELSIDLISFLFTLLFLVVITYFLSCFLFVLGSIYKDAFHLWTNFTTLLFWAVPIIYSSSQLPERFHSLAKINILFGVFQDLEMSIKGENIITLTNITLLSIFIVLSFLVERYLEGFRNKVILKL